MVEISRTNGSPPAENETLRNTWLRALKDFRITLTFLSSIVGIGLLFLWLQKVADPYTAFLTALACLAVGGIVGFLFGIPRVLQKTDSTGTVQQPGTTGEPSAGSIAAAGALPYRLQVNTNLEQISDWLTKIIVGIGLIELRRLPEAMESLSRFVSSGLDLEHPSLQAVSSVLIVYFGILGFLTGYLITRIYLAGAFYRADWSAQNSFALQAAQVRSNVEKESKQILNEDPEAGKKITEGQIQAAERVERVAGRTDIAYLRTEMKKLANDYEAVRASMPEGDRRTRRMEEVVTKMRTLALACEPLLGEFADSAAPGERLSAIVILQVRPKPDWLRWLADRLKIEKPFIGYHAAVALLSAARLLDEQARPSLLSAIQLAKATSGGRLEGTDRWDVLSEAERELV